MHGDHSVHSDLRSEHMNWCLGCSLWVQSLRISELGQGLGLAGVTADCPSKVELLQVCAEETDVMLRNAGYAPIPDLQSSPSKCPGLIAQLHARERTPKTLHSSPSAVFAKTTIQTLSRVSLRIPQPTAPMVAFAMASAQAALSGFWMVQILFEVLGGKTSGLWLGERGLMCWLLGSMLQTMLAASLP